jgi:ribonuclease HII
MIKSIKPVNKRLITHKDMFLNFKFKVNLVSSLILRMKQNLAISTRTRKILDFDSIHRRECGGFLCGIDEAGRGPIAGPVVAAAVIFSDDIYIESVFDSKQLTHKKRDELYELIRDSAHSFGIGMADTDEIDRFNILQATMLAMHRAVEKLKSKPGKIIADGNFYKSQIAPVENIIRGDEKSFSIAAASILAKVTRDRMMEELGSRYPHFSFGHHKGYCTRAHIDELLEHGYTDVHRRSFKIKAVQLELL